ncbi:phage tail assembly chaperone [Mongoliimonas terrestris]|uniref:phage tail assembly chaperone n=1 Tax=Mongoliimonas terrestris TaxID=1709001 RepID=UPI0015880B96|nr:phage tail assembly chaperone [Mongoliimonas terrestris]
MRAATILCRRHGGDFRAIVAGVLAGNVTIIADVIRTTVTKPTTIPDVCLSLPKRAIELCTAPVLEVVLAMAGIDPAAKDTTPAEKHTKAEAVSYENHFRRLYQIGTGWLGWTPETTWSATPAELEEAFLGKAEMLRAIHGGEDPTAPQPKLTVADKLARFKAGAVREKPARTPTGPAMHRPATV